MAGDAILRSRVVTLMSITLLPHAGEVGRTTQMARLALHAHLDLVVVHPAPNGCSGMAEVATSRRVDQIRQREGMVGRDASYPCMGAIVTDQTVAPSESSIIVQISGTGKAPVVSRMAGLAVRYSNCRCAGMYDIDRLRHTIRGAIDRVRVAVRAGGERNVMLEVVAIEIIVIRVARVAICQAHGHHESVVLSGSRVVAPRPSRIVAGLAILTGILRTGMVPACRHPGTGAMALVA